MIKIPLTQGKFALIDDEDYPIVSLFKWHAQKDRNTFYAKVHIWINKTKYIPLSMHRLIMNLNPYEQGDHKDRNGLNNQKSNLRECTRSQNKMNSKKYKNSLSKYKGVYWNKQIKKWRAMIRINKKLTHLGCFKDEVEAAKTYDKFAKKHYGDFAKLNF